MPQNQQNRNIDDLFDLLNNRVYRSRRQNRVLGPEGYRVIEEAIDDTAIGPNNETENGIINNEVILDCGHPAKNNLGGRCHYCDNIVCKSCISICSSCGLAICPPHTVRANFSGEQQCYCRSCADEISRSLKFHAVVNRVLSFFFK